MLGDLKLKILADTSQLKKSMADAGSGAGGLASGKSSGAGGILGGLGKMTMLLGAIAGGIALIVSSSKVLEGTLKQVMRLVGFLLRPIGDILAVGLMPLISILKPLGKMVNAMMRPYLQKARAAMRMGGEFMKAGEGEKAAESFMLGFAYMIKPLTDTLIIAQSHILGTIVSLPFELLGNALKGLGEILGDNMIGNAFTSLGESMLNASEVTKNSIVNLGNKLIEMGDEVLDKKMGQLMGGLVDTSGWTKDKVVEKFGDLLTESDVMMNSFKDTISGESGYLSALNTETNTKMSSFNMTMYTYLDALDSKAATLLNSLKDKVDQADDFTKVALAGFTKGFLNAIPGGNIAYNLI